MTTVKRRYPIAEITLFPTVVQGDKAAGDVVANIARVEASGDFDTMIIGRGGGSIEDLWPFNEEKVARAIFAAKTPIISSVGHETDTTIADLVADVRAATPTAAAELAVPVLSDEILKIKEKQTRLEQAFMHQLALKKERYERLSASYVLRQPERLYEAQSIKLDQLTQRLLQSTQNRLFEEEKKVMQLNHNLRQFNPKNRVNELKQQQNYLQERLEKSMKQLFQQKQQSFHNAIQSLDLLSPLKIMGRGYSYTTKEDNVIKSVAEITVEDKLVIHYQDGQVEAAVTKINPEDNRK